MQNKKKSFLGGAFVLAVAGFICKIIGAVYKIPLRHYVGEATMGVYSTVYPIYTFLLIFSTSGIPTAISKLVAEERSKGNNAGAHRIFISSIKLLLLIGGITTALMLFGSPIIAQWLKIDSYEPIAAIAFSLLFVSLLSAFRGYYQGLQNMIPTAITQVVEQIVKLIAGFYFSITWLNNTGSYVLSAAGALLGITISELVAFIVIFIMYLSNKKNICDFTDNNRKQQSSFAFFKPLLAIAIPMTIGAAIKPLVDGIDSIMVKNILLVKLNFFSEYADALYGYLKSDCGTLINMPTVLTVALSMALVPAMSSALARNDGSDKKIAKTGFKLSLIFGLPCSIGFAMLSKEILSLLYNYETKLYGNLLFTQQEKLACAADFLTILSIGVLFLFIVQTTAGILQGIGKVVIPVINLGIGMAVKIIMNFVLVSNPAINIYGVPIGTVTCYAIAAILDVFFVIKYVKIKIDVIDIFLKPIAASGLMVIVIAILKMILGNMLLSGTMGKLLTVAVIGVGAIFYLIGVVFLKAFDKSDLSLMPGGAKLEKLFNKLGVKLSEGE